MKKTVLLVVLLTLVAFVSGAIAAAPPKGAGTTPPPPPKLEKFTGDIKSVDAMAKSIVVTKPGKVPEDKTFFVDDKTKITKGKDALTFADLKAGIHIVIEYKKEMDKMIAETIKVVTLKAAPKAK